MANPDRWLDALEDREAAREYGDDDCTPTHDDEAAWENLDELVESGEARNLWQGMTVTETIALVSAADRIRARRSE